MIETKPLPLARTLLLVAPYVHEREHVTATTERLRALACDMGCPEPATVAIRRPRPTEIPEGSYIVVDSLVRLGSSPMEVLKWVAAAQEKQITVYTGTGLKLCPGIVRYDLVRRVLQGILSVSREHRSLKTRESLYLARQRGQQIGRQPLPDATVKAALAELERQGGNIRGAARCLQRRGVQISRSALGRLAQAQRRGGRHE